jgi:hypothetical protein
MSGIAATAAGFVVEGVLRDALRAPGKPLGVRGGDDAVKAALHEQHGGAGLGRVETPRW